MLFRYSSGLFHIFKVGQVIGLGMIAGYGRLPHQKEGMIALILALAVFETLAVVCVDDQSVLKTMLR